MFKTVAGFIVLVVGLSLIASLVGSIFMYMSWNWGMAAALPNLCHSISWSQAFWLSMCLSSIGNLFKTTVTVNK